MSAPTGIRRSGVVPGAACLGAFGTSLISITLAWLLVEAGASTFVVTILYAATAAPQLAIGLPTGVIGDRFGHRAVIVIGEACAGVFLMILTGLAAVDVVGTPVVLVGAVVLACADTARQANIQILANPNRNGQSAPDSLNSLAALNIGFLLGMVCGAAAGGALYPLISATGIFALAGGAHFGVAVLLVMAPATTERMSEGPAPSPKGAATIRLLRDVRPVRDLFVVVIGVEILMYSAVALLPTYTDSVLHQGSFTLGIIKACFSIGGLIALLVLTKARRFRRVAVLFVSIPVGAGALLGICLTSVAWVTGAMALVLGASLACIDATSQSLMQALAPPKQRGAVAGLWVMAVGFAPIGLLAAGATATSVGVPATIAALGVASLAASLVAFRLPLFSELRSSR